jgi:DNA-binding NarL/FixJ family response regulator
MQAQAASTIHVLVADNTRMYAELLADALGRDRNIKVVGALSDSRHIQEEVKLHERLDIAVLGANLDEAPLHGIVVLRELRRLRPELKGVILLDSSKREVTVEAFRAGARGLFSRHEPLETLSKCVRQVHAGQVWANSEQVAYAVDALALSPNIRAVDANGLNLLSRREIEVVRSLAEGLTNREIATRLGLSQHTIKNYLFRIFDKLGVSSRMELLFLTLNQTTAAGFPEISTQKKNGHPPQAPGLAECLRGADQGIPLAQVTAARMYFQGKGVAQNYAEAYLWYVISENSCRSLSAEIHAAKTKLEMMLTPEEISKIQERVAEKIKQISQPTAMGGQAAHV